MFPITSRARLALSAIGLATIGMFATQVVLLAPAAAMPVFDSANYAQNLLTAARTLLQINKQIESLQNEAKMLVNMGKNLARIDFPQLEKLRAKLQEIDRLMGQAQGIDFRVDQLDAQFRKLFPQQFTAALKLDQRVRDARTRLDASMAAFRQAMTIQSGVVENVRDDAEALSEIVARSQGAEGSLQAHQATNQLLALTTKQQFQLQQMMAAQFRADSIEQARRAQQSQAAREATRKFLGTGTAYTPR